MIVFLGNPCFSQKVTSEVRGKVTSEEGEPLPNTYIYIKGTSQYTETDADGRYRLSVTADTFTLVCSAMGYVDQTTKISLDGKQSVTQNFVLAADGNMSLDAVQLVGKSRVQKVRETAYNVVVLDAKGLYNTTADLGELLNKSSGVKVRATGGVGSDVGISLNGFTGKHVKVFIDGVPMDGFGSAFQINNISLNIADRIEVYKGVVPIELGSDALGGAINIITNQKKNTFLDASYSFGSFNTHRSNVNMGYTAKSGFTAQLNLFQNYSDNSYKVKTHLLNLENNSYSREEYWFKRFHDTYHNETAIAKVGAVNQKWADKLLIGATIGQEYDEIQNANLMKIVYGGKKRTSSSVIPSLEYSKSNLFTEGLKFSLMANYSQVRNKNIDTLARQYNWTGNYRTKTSKGESQYSLGEFRDNNGSVIANLSYKLTTQHLWALNNTFTTFERKSSDPLSQTSTGADNIKRANSKNVLGASYTYKPSSRWTSSVFGKYYSVNVTGPIDVSTTTTAQYEERHRSFSQEGFGLASTYVFSTDWQIKGSYEKTYRLPTTNELFGDEILETGDASLKAENSHNLNLNLSYAHTFGTDHSVYFDMGFIYRNINDYIRRQIEQRYGGAYYTNHGQVQNVGADVEARYMYADKFSLGGNVTYQNIRNKEKYSPTGQPLIYYNDRMPNVPYFFGNADAAYYVHNLWGEGNTLTLGYDTQYVHEFFRQWESEGAASSKKTIPSQWSHDLSMTYSLKNGKYNISLEARNITDEILYDNYSLQKPGRSFYIKLRYFFNQ